MKVHSILVPVEMSEITGTVVRAAANMGRLIGAPLTFLHVVEPEWRRTASGYDTSEPTEDEFRDIEKSVAKRIATILSEADADAEGGTPRIEVLCGDPYEVILEAVKRLNPDMIVMGTHGRRGLSHMFLGSVAEKIVRLAPCPVLTVKPKPGDGES